MIGDRRDLFITDEYVRRLDQAIEEIYRYPLCLSAADRINRQLKTGLDDERLFDLVFILREDGKLCVVDDRGDESEPQLICSMGLAPDATPSAAEG